MKHGEMEYTFMNLALETAARDAAFTGLTMTNGNMSTQLRQQEDHIWAQQEELSNLKLAEATHTAEVKINNKGGQKYALKKNRNISGQLIPRKK